MKWDEHQREIAKKIDRWERHAIFKGGLELGEQKGERKGERKGFAKGLELGERKFQKEIVLRLDGMGFEPEQIVNITDVSLEDVQKILNGEDLNSDQ